MNIILYKKVPCDGDSNSNIIQYFSAEGIITEQYPDGKTFSWRRLPSNLWVQMPQDWVPGEVVRRLEGQRPLKMVPQTQPPEKYMKITKQQDDESKERTSSRKPQYPGRKPSRHDPFQQCLIRLP